MTEQLGSSIETDDRLVLWPIFFLLAAVLLLVFIGKLVGVIVFMAISAATLIFLGVLLSKGIFYFWHRSWRRGLSLIAAFAMFWPLAFGCLRASDYIVLVAAFPYYAAQVYCSGSNSQSSFYFGAGAHYGKQLIYDPSDQLAKNIGTVDERADNMEAVITKRLFTHWFVQTQNWGSN